MAFRSHSKPDHMPQLDILLTCCVIKNKSVVLYRSTDLFAESLLGREVVCVDDGMLLAQFAVNLKELGVAPVDVPLLVSNAHVHLYAHTSHKSQLSHTPSQSLVH